MTIPNSAQATAYSIPINGRFANSKITLEIPSTPKWAHDIVLNASLVWNKGQLWFQHTYFPDGNVYTFVESSPANVTISYALPLAYAGFAVGWTDYAFAPSSTTIVSVRTFLDPSVFNQAQANNATAHQYAFRLALHELGRVLGLGNVIDGKDIMDPLATPYRATQPPMLSTLDLYAVHILASTSSLTSLVVVLNTDQYQLLSAWSFLTNLPNEQSLVPSISSSAKKFVSSYELGKSPNLNEESSGHDSVNRLIIRDAMNLRIQRSTLFYELLIVICAFSSLGILLQRRSQRSKQLEQLQSHHLRCQNSIGFVCV